jgi:hypothetical protein
MHKYVALIVVVAACGGGTSRTPTTPQPDVAPGASPCIAMAAHMRELVLSTIPEKDEFTDQALPVVERVVSERCQADAWEPAVIDCIHKADGEKAFEACIDRLTDAQEQAVEDQIEKELTPIEDKYRQEHDEKSTPAEAPAGGAPPPPPAPDDPCGGGP